MTRRSAALQLVLALSFCHVGLAQHTGTFTQTGDMMVPRIGHTATLLPDGRVLIAGGSEYGWTLSIAELYDPSTGSFTATGNMTTARTGHSAILLPDGKVLIAGGGCPGLHGECTVRGSLAVAELYDPSTGTFSATGSMATAGSGLTWPILLNDGKVLIARGSAGNSPGPAELYDPVTGTFSGTGDQPATGFLSATLLSDGRVLFVSSCGSDQLYDPASGTFSLAGNPKHCDEFAEFAAAALADGRVLFAGGWVGCYEYSSGAALYDPSSGSFRTTGDMTTSRADHTAALLPDGTVLIAGGRGYSANTAVTAEIYDPATGAFSRTGDMTGPREANTTTWLLDGRVLRTGGHTPEFQPQPLASAEVYTPSILVPIPVVNAVRFDRMVVPAGSSYSVDLSGSNLTPEMYFDVRFTGPERNESAVALNWQKGLVINHGVPAGLAQGSWTITGVRAHEIETDHTGIFFPVSATITVSLAPSIQTFSDRIQTLFR
jgi:hypothetical protein